MTTTMTDAPRTASAGPYFDPLTAYLEWILSRPLAALRVPPDAGLRDYGRVLSVVVHRQAPFQTELFLVRAGEGFPEEHRHPHVDSFEVPVGGRIYFTLNGQPILSAAEVDTLAGLGWPREVVAPQRVRPTDWHGARVGPEGAAFLSVQVWLEGLPPSSVGLDWEGTPVHDAQAGLWAQEGRTGPVAPADADPAAPREPGEPR